MKMRERCIIELTGLFVLGLLAIVGGVFLARPRQIARTPLSPPTSTPFFISTPALASTSTPTRAPLPTIMLTLSPTSTPTPTFTPTITIIPTPIPQSSMPGELEKAREALITFFRLLHNGNYSEAIHYYGGSYDPLRDMNPTIPEDDYAALLKNGCEINGLVCLRIKSIVREEETSPGEFKFIVEFMKEDGTLFALGPCCGATEEEMPPQTQFSYTVKKVDNRFLVQELPVYAP